MAKTRQQHAIAKSQEGRAKKRKISEVESNEKGSDALTTFGGFKLRKILRKSISTKSLCLLGSFESRAKEITSGSSKEPRPEYQAADEAEDEEKDSEEQVVVVLEYDKKPAFIEDKDDLLAFMSAETSLTRIMQNDIYGVYDCVQNKTLPASSGNIKARVIYPATEKHIQKYSNQTMHLTCETAEDYRSVTLPYLEEKPFKIQWVFNILEKKAEADRIVFEDTDPQKGFVMLPDMKWDGKQTDNLYVIVIARQRGIRSLRDLNASHLPLLCNIQQKCTKFIGEKFKVPANQLTAYFHYQPSYYHLHVHFTNRKLKTPMGVHHLSTVILNITAFPDYYQQCLLVYNLRENDELFQKLREAREQTRAPAVVQPPSIDKAEEGPKAPCSAENTQKVQKKLKG